MNAKTVADLEKTIEAWFGKKIESSLPIPTPSIGSRTFEMAAVAALSVLYAMENQQQESE